MVEEFAEFAQKAHVTNEEVALNGGVIWHSARHNGPAGEYDAPLPPGLHISCGIAEIHSYSKDCGGFESKGPSINVLHVPDSGTVFQTKVGAGAVRSFGYYLPTLATESDDPLIRLLVEQATNQPMISFEGKLQRMVPRLTALISAQYQGCVRETLLQSRAMELMALVAGELDVTAFDAPRATLQHSAELTRDYIETHLSAAPHLQEIARATGVSVRSMTGAFRKTFGESIAEYSRRRRMEEAAALIELGASVSEAAYQVGYSPNAFSRAFRAQFGKPPSA